MTRVRRHFTAMQKAEVVRRHVAGKEAVSTLAEEPGVQPTLIHQWVQQLLAPERRERGQDRSRDRACNSVALPSTRSPRSGIGTHAKNLRRHEAATTSGRMLSTNTR
jgi:transposase-like protein